MYFSVTIVFSPVSISGIIHGKKKKKFEFTGIEVLLKVLFMGDWRENRKECRVGS